MALTFIKSAVAAACATLAALAPLGPFAQSPGDADVLAAKEAAQRGQWKVLDSYRARLAGHVLEPYPTYWLLAGNIERSDPREVQAFLARYPDSPLAESLRREWLKALGASSSWELFRAEYPRVVGDDIEIACYSFQERLARAKPDEAAERLAGMAPRLSNDAVAHSWGQVAWQAALTHHPRALEWYALAGNAPLTDTQVMWRARAALRVADWKKVLASIQALSAEEAREPNWRYWRARALKNLGAPEAADALLKGLAGQPSFYGLIAAEDLGISTAPDWNGWRPPQADLDRVRAFEGIQRALTLYRLDLG